MKNLNQRSVAFVTKLVALSSAFLFLGVGVGSDSLIAQTKGVELTSSWTKFSSTEGGFSALYPAQPKTRTQEVEMIGIRLVMTIMSSARTSEESSAVGYVDAPVTMSGDSMLKVMTKATEEQYGARGGKVESSDFTEGGCKGKEIIIRRETKYWATRLILSGTRLYVVLYVSSAESPDTARYARVFLNSFEVDGGCKPVEVARTSETLSTTIDGETDAVTGWKRIHSSEDQFSVLMPSDASLKERQTEPGSNNLLIREYTSVGDAAVTVVITVRGTTAAAEKDELPKGALNTASIGLIEVLNKRGVEATFARMAKIGNYSAKEYVLKMRGLNGKAWLFSSPHRLYLFSTICQQETGCEETSNRFVSSIRITGE